MVRLFLLTAGVAVVCAGTAMAETGAASSKSDRYIYCTFRPQAPSCQDVYRQAISDPNPEALSVKDAYDHYGRYVRSAREGLTDKDRQFLKANGIALPPDLAESDLKGLHAVIHDPELKDADMKRIAVDGFLSRAIEAELYCGFNACEQPPPNKGESTRTS